MSWYREGTINLVKGSVDVVGVGTAFKSEVRFSDILLVNGVLTEIIRVESDTKLKLATAWSGENLTGASFAVIRNLTNASNYDLMKKIEGFLIDRQRSMDEFVDWINAAPVTTGAPDAGKFPMTDRYGVTVYCKSPRQLEYEAQVRLNRQDELIDETEAILTESEARLTAIGNQQAWANQILGYKNDAAASAALAQKWAENPENSAVTTGEYSAKHHAIKAAASQVDVTTRQADVTTKHNNVIALKQQAQAARTAAQTSETNAKTSETNAAGSATGAASSASAAASSATTASTKATEASNSATASATSATNALASEIKASKWAEEAENTLVETGKYSAKHHALKAAASATAASTSATNAATAKTAAETARTGAQTAEANAVSAKTAAEAARDRAELAASSLTGNLSEYGGIDLSGGAYPAAPESAGFWKVTVGGTVDGIKYGVGDTLVYSKNLNEFYKIDNTESVSSVNGKTGVVSLTAADVGAVSTTGNAATATKLQTSRTINGVSFDGTANITVADSTKEPAFAAGTTAQYLRGDKTWQNFATAVRASVMTGLSTVTTTAVLATDTLLAAIGKLQAQITDAASNLAGSVRATVLTGYVSGSNAVLASTDTVLAAFGKLQAQITNLATSKLDATDNAVSATKLQTARTINGVAFNGTANITVADSTKMPVAGGTFTGLAQTRNSGINTSNGAGSQAFQVMGTTTTGAVFSLHRVGAYAINIGLDTDNVFRIGGWTDGAVHRMQLDVAGNFTARGNVTAYSDARLKTDIQVIPDALSKVNSLRGVTYERIDTGERQTGVIAQEVQAVLPEAVMDGGGHLSVAYGNMVGLMIQAIKELNAKVDALTTEVEMLRGSQQ